MNVFRAALARNLWITGIAIARYMPRAFRVKQVDGNQFFTDEKRQEYRRRVESVTPNSQRQWGTMEVDQMLHHLNLACGGVAGLLRSSRRELSDFEDAFQMDSRGLVSRTAGRVTAPDGLQNPTFTEI